MNFTITVPEGTTNHGNPNLLCTPAKWYDLIIFFSANYFAHSATVIVNPGQSLIETGILIFFALILPGAGIVGAVSAIVRHAATETKNPLNRAARAGALCMVLKVPESGTYATQLRSQRNMLRQWEREDPVVETEEGQLTHTGGISSNAVEDKDGGEPQAKPGPGSAEKVSSTVSSGSPWWDPPIGCKPVPPGTAIHGEHWLDKDSKYYLAIVPPTASMQFAPDSGKDITITREPENKPEAIVASSYNFLKLFISLIQAIWAVTTIYRARGDQIQQYGYAAFGLTVAPYAFMSVMNTLANMLTPDYPSMFLIRTPTMNKS
ncbi:hypothetical protein DL771_009222 [Monosporascus sp. 5C6A]|nr:hypothetical protein DL771_009222 [Monosporascus sp. 5C6A]